ncbi:MAG: hypothetical protein KBT21_01565 [Treponema sp.]|nr:hypothetical protein [Candidatus Treponema merdequi]
MMKNKILIAVLSAGILAVCGCSSPSGSSGNSLSPAPILPPSLEKKNKITVTVQEGSDIAITKSENGEAVTLTAEEGYSDFNWYLDAEQKAVAEESSYTFVPSKGVTMIFLTAKKDGVKCSATYYIKK